jgi:hypothetical protein
MKRPSWPRRASARVAGSAVRGGRRGAGRAEVQASAGDEEHRGAAIGDEGQLAGPDQPERELDQARRPQPGQRTLGDQVAIAHPSPGLLVDRQERLEQLGQDRLGEQLAGEERRRGLSAELT